MDYIEKALKLLVKLARLEFEKSRLYERSGMADDTYFDTFGYLADIIYFIVGEKTDSFDESVTYSAMHDDAIYNEQRVEMLMEEYQRNHPSE